MKEPSIEELAREARRKYQNEWRKKNPEKVRATHERYWLRKAEKMLQEQQEKDV